MKTITVLTYRSASFPQIRGISYKSVGRSFELLTVNALKRYCFEVSVCGGARDRGIDFRGFWKLNSRTVNILGQCKYYKRRLGPVHVRELEGAISHEHQASLALLVTNTGFTKAAYEHFMSSTYPLALTLLDTTVSHHFDEEMLGQTDEALNKNNLSLNNLVGKNVMVPSQEESNIDYEKRLLHGGNLSLFELNMTAKQFLPEIVIGRSLKGKSCPPMLLLHKDSSVSSI